MLSRALEKLLRKLEAKKQRAMLRMFVAEGRKVVEDILGEGLRAEHIIVREDSSFINENAIVVDGATFKKSSRLNTADEVIAIFPFPEVQRENSDIVLILDGIKDPGNLGTIIRNCDWFGVSTVYCTHGTTDIYNSKTVQSTMGSIVRINVKYLAADEIFAELQQEGYQFFCADMEGTDISDFKMSGKTAIVMGSESHGISEFWKGRSGRISIPKFGESRIDSLNVGVATAVILSHLRLG